MDRGMKLVQSKDYFIEAIEGEWLLFKPRAQKAIYLDESASIIWQMCDGSRSADELAQEIASNYGDEKDTVIADVHATLAVLQEHGALKGV